jgi:hypothetical protein
MAARDIEPLLNIYDLQLVFLNERLNEERELNGDIALMHTERNVPSARPMRS